MTPFRLNIVQAVRDVLVHLPPSLKHKVKTALHALAENPYQAKTLKDDLAGLRSYRLARSRIILQIKGSTVEIVAFGPRKDIYQRVAIELRCALRSPGKKTPRGSIE
jgi:mRNA-degrading endonuclease RelE of RelBE toxin-antitoxin system